MSSQAKNRSFSRRALLRGATAAGAAAVASPLLRLADVAPVRAEDISVPRAGGPIPRAAPDADPHFAALGATVRKLMEEMHVPGVSLGLLINGREQTAGFGVTNIEHPLPVDADTLFQIGSITKTYTATAMMRLIERGTLDLDAPVRTYLPDFRVADPEVGARVTLRHLVTHTSGWWGDYFQETGGGDDALAKYVASMATLPQASPIGQFINYNNAALSVLGRVIEVATGKSYETAMRELVLAPLGLAQSFYFPADVLTYEYAVGHQMAASDLTVARPWALPRSVAPAGGLTASVRDQLRYARFHMGDGTASSGERLLTRASLDRMRTPIVRDVFDPNLAVGVSWILTRAGDVQFAMHDGGTNGQRSLLAMAPERGFALAVLTNADGGDALAHAVLDQAATLYLGQTIPEPSHEPVSLPAEALADYVGAYRVPGFVDINIRLLNGALIFTVHQYEDPLGGPLPEPFTLQFTAKDRAFGDVGGVDFLRKPDGSVGWVTVGARVMPRVG